MKSYSTIEMNCARTTWNGKKPTFVEQLASRFTHTIELGPDFKRDIIHLTKALIRESGQHRRYFAVPLHSS